MGDVKVVMNDAGARSLLNSGEVQAECKRQADKVCARANSIGSGTYVSDVRPGKSRAHAMVKTTDAKSMASNANHNTLLKAMG